MAEEDIQEGELALHGAGEKLRMAREQAGMDLAHVAAETRIPQRHLELIEAGRFSELPARTYAVGFSRSYAKLVGLNEREIVDEVRAELAESEGDRGPRAATFEPGDPARVPSRGLAWLSALAIVLLLAGGYVFYRTFFVAGTGPGSLVTAEQQREAAQRSERREAAAAPAPIDPEGEVAFTALEEGIWVKFYDAQGRQLMQKQMAKGERYVVPADADGPQLWTGRPDALSITIDGRSVPRLAEEDQVMKDVPVTAEALLARGEAGAQEAGAQEAGAQQAGT